jgi:hypothetical protein
LIERVRAGSWNPETNEGDREQRNAMAARGYWLAFRATGRTGRTKVAVRSGRVAMLSGWDCAWTTSLMRVPCLERLGEVALLAEGNDVVVKGLEVAVGDDGDSEGGVLAAVLGDAAGG